MQLLDGVLRKELAADSDVPMLVVDLTDDEAGLLLATADPIGEMAETSKDKLEEMLSEIGLGSSGLTDYLAKLGTDNGIVPPAGRE